MSDVQITNGGTNTMVSTREAPWMKLGKLTDEAMTAREAAKEGGLDFTVSLRNVYYTCDQTDEGTDNVQPDCLKRMTNRRVVVRDDTGDPLGIVSATYPPLQYSEAFDFMDTVGTHYVAAGALKGGKQGFMVARPPSDVKMNVLGGDDPHELFIVLRTSHDLTRAIEVMVMPLRGRCMNQLTLQSFSAGVEHRWAVRHTSSMQGKLAEAQVSLQKLSAYVSRYQQLAERLANIKVNEEKARLVLKKVIPARAKQEETIDRVIQMMKSSPTVGWDGTGWGLVNAVSDLYDWQRQGGTAESRFLGALQGQTHKAINKATVHLLRQAA